MQGRRRNRLTRAVLFLAAVALATLVAAPLGSGAAAHDGKGERATASASVKKRVKKLNKKFKQLQQQLAEVSSQQGPAGPPGPPGEQGPPGSANAWSLTGNAGTSGASFLGTTDDQALNLRVNDARGLRLEPASDGTNVSPNVIGGIADNTVTAGVHSATIAGGGRDDPANPVTANRVTDNRGTVGGGTDNQATRGRSPMRTGRRSGEASGTPRADHSHSWGAARRTSPARATR